MKNMVFIFVCISLISCIKEPERQPQTKVVTYSFEAARDMGQLFDFTVTYIDQNNRSVTERITDLPWQKQIAVPPPSTHTCMLTFQPKRVTRIRIHMKSDLKAA